MSAMISEVYAAFREAGASEEKARQTAEAVAGYENRFTELRRDIDQRFANMDRDMAVLRWMVGFNLVMTVAILWKVFS